MDRIVDEGLRMSRFKHTHVMGLIGMCINADSCPYVIMPYMAYGSLLSYLQRERKRIVIEEVTDDDEVISSVQ